MDRDREHISHLHWQKMLLSVPAAAIQLGPGMACLFANKTWEELTGLPPEASLGNGWQKAFADKDIRVMLHTMEKAAREKKGTATLEMRLDRPGRKIQYCRADVCFFFDEKAAFQYATAFLRPEQEEEAKDFQTLITSLEDIVIEIDMNKTFRNVWTRDDNLLFMPRSMFLGKTIGEVFGENAFLFSGPIDEVIATGRSKEFIYEDIYSDSHKWYKAKVGIVTRNKQTGEQTLVVIVRDHTETVKYENALKEVTSKLEQGKRLLDISQELSFTSGWEYDFKSRKITLTRQAYLIYDLDDDFIPTSDNMRPFYAPKDWMKLKTCFVNMIRNKKPFDLELLVTTAKNKKKWVRIIASPVQEKNDSLTCTGAFMDISGMKEIEAELIEARDIAERAARDKTEFLSIMSHEIRTPLNNIIGLLNLLKLNHTPEQQEYINHLIFSSDHLLQLINDILDLHKIERGKHQEPLQPVGLTELIRGIENQFAPFARERSIRLSSRVDRQIPAVVLANPTRLGQILNNLINNAIKFTDEGEVTITAALRSMQRGRAVVHFSVKDTGIGIPAEFHQTIFESFRQLTQSAARKYPSTGLGLTITKKLIESQGSRIMIKSAPGKGTEFYFDLKFKLPAEKKGSGSDATKHPLPALDDYKGRLGHIRLLLIEDNPLSVVITKNQLKYFGIEPDCAAGGGEAMALLEANPYHIALLDLHIPDIDGYTMATRISEQYPAIQIILFTADVIHASDERFAALPIAGTLNKPFFPEELLHILLKATGNNISKKE